MTTLLWSGVGVQQHQCKFSRQGSEKYRVSYQHCRTAVRIRVLNGRQESRFCARLGRWGSKRRGHARSQQFDVLVVEALARLSRDMEGLDDIHKRLIFFASKSELSVRVPPKLFLPDWAVWLDCFTARIVSTRFTATNQATSASIAQQRPKARHVLVRRCSIWRLSRKPRLNRPRRLRSITQGRLRLGNRRAPHRPTR